MSNFLRVSSDKTDARPEGAFPFHKTRIHRQTRARAQAAPPAFWPAVTLLLSVAVSLICWGLYNALPQMAAAGEKHLRQTPFSSKFNPTSIEAPPAKPPEQCPELEFEHGPLLASATAEPPLAALPSNPPLASPPVASAPVASCAAAPPAGGAGAAFDAAQGGRALHAGASVAALADGTAGAAAGGGPYRRS